MQKWKGEREMLSFSGCTIYEDNLYSITDCENLVIVLDMKQEKISYIHNILNYKSNMMTSGLDVAITVNDEIYFFRQDGKSVLVYDVKNNLCRNIVIECHASDSVNFAAITQSGQYIYIFPKCGTKLVKFNVKTKEIIYENKMCGKSDLNPQTKVFSCGCRVDNKIWLFGNKTNKVIEFDLQTEEYSEHMLSIGRGECIDATYADDIFYLLNDFGQVIKWNIQTGATELLVDEQNVELPFARIIAAHNNIWLLPACGDDIYIIDRTTEVIEQYRLYPEDFSYNDMVGWGKYYGSCEDENNYYIAMRRANYLLCINKMTGRERWIKPQLPNERETFLACKDNHSVLDERWYGLRRYIDGILYCE